MDFTIVSREVIVVPGRADDASAPSVLDGLRMAAGAAVGALGAAALGAGERAFQAVSSVAGPPTAALLDAVVPSATKAVVTDRCWHFFDPVARSLTHHFSACRVNSSASLVATKSRRSSDEPRLQATEQQ